MLNEQAIEVSQVPDSQRTCFLPKHFGTRFMLRGEALVYAWMDRLSDDYRGGFWNFLALSNGGFFLAPARSTPMRVTSENGFDGMMSAEAAGIVATLYALCQLANQTCEDDLIEKYHALRDFALSQHAEAACIAQAID